MGDASLGQTMLFLTYMGLVNLFANLAPALLLLQFGFEKFSFEFIPWTKFMGFIFLTFRE